MKKNSTQNPTVSSQVDENEEIEWEVRPGGMLVQKRDDVVDDTAAASTGGPTIKITVSHGPARHEVHVPAQSSFGILLYSYPSLLYLWFYYFICGFFFLRNFITLQELEMLIFDINVVLKLVFLVN